MNLQCRLIPWLLAVLASSHTGDAGTVVRTWTSTPQAVIAVASDGTISLFGGSVPQPDPPSAIKHFDQVAPRLNHSLTPWYHSIRNNAAILGFIPHAHLHLAASLGTLMWDMLSLDADDHMNLREWPSKLEKANWDVPKYREIRSHIKEFLLATAMIGVLLVYLPGAIYCTRVTNNRRVFPNPVPFGWSLENNDFKHGLCDCTDDTNYCLTAWFCPLCRDADTYAAAGAAPYWSVFTTPCLIQILAMVVFDILGSAIKSPEVQSLGLPFGLILQSCYFACMRQQLRIALGGNGTECCMDCLCYHFCACCIIAQNARHVDAASRAYVAFCCTLTYAPDESSIPIVVGIPVPVPSPNAAAVAPTTSN